MPTKAFWVCAACTVAAAGLAAAGCRDDDVPPSGSGDAGVRTDAGAPGDAGAVRTELAYDLGAADEASSPWGTATNVAIAVRFTAPAYPARLVRARFWVPDVGMPTTPFGVRVFAADGATEMPAASLLDAGRVTVAAPAGDRWVEADLSAADVTATGDFYVAMDWLTAPGPMGEAAQFLGSDRDAPARRTWWFAGGAWIRVEDVGSPSGDRNAMIRCTVDY